MGVANILSSIDREIAILQQARALLIGESTTGPRKARTPLEQAVQTAKKTGKKRKLTPEGRRRIAEAVKRRWVKHRKAAAK